MYENLKSCPDCHEYIRAGESLCHKCKEKLGMISFSSCNYTSISWIQSDPDSFVKYKNRGACSDDVYKESPFKSSRFSGWCPLDVAQFIDNWRVGDLMS